MKKGLDLSFALSTLCAATAMSEQTWSQYARRREMRNEKTPPCPFPLDLSGRHLSTLSTFHVIPPALRAVETVKSTSIISSEASTTKPVTIVWNNEIPGCTGIKSKKNKNIYDLYSHQRCYRLESLELRRPIGRIGDRIDSSTLRRNCNARIRLNLVEWIKLFPFLNAYFRVFRVFLHVTNLHSMSDAKLRLVEILTLRETSRP